MWVTIGSFVDDLDLGGEHNGTAHFGPMDDTTRAAFFYVCSSFAGQGSNTTSTGSYTVKAYDGKPSAGGIVVSTNTYTPTIDDGTIAASQNTVNAIWADINPSVLGATTTLTVDGDTGTIGCTNSASRPS